MCLFTSEQRTSVLDIHEYIFPDHWTGGENLNPEPNKLLFGVTGKGKSNISYRKFSLTHRHVGTTL